MKSQILCTPETQVVIHGENCSVYKIENETGEGIITRYPVFPGIEILYNDIHMTHGVSHNEAPRSNVVEINHCRVGRFECEFSRGGSIYLGEGDLAVNVMTNVTNQTWFPLSHYHGITIAVDIPVAESILKQLSEVMGKGLDFDLSAIRDRLCAKNSCFIMRATDSIQHIFSELYRVPQDLKDGYFKIKVIELFLFLNSPEIGKRQRANSKCGCGQQQSKGSVFGICAGSVDGDQAVSCKGVQCRNNFEYPISLCWRNTSSFSLPSFADSLFYDLSGFGKRRKYVG